MKKICICLFFIIFTSLICSLAFSEDIEPGRPFIELLGGIFPNSDLQANTYVEGTLRYNSSFKSSFLVDIKDHTKKEKSDPDDGETEETIDGNKKTFIEVTLLEWVIPLVKSKNGLNIKFTPGIKCDYIFDEKSYLFQDIWEDDFGVNQLYLEKEDTVTYVLLPMISSFFDFQFSHAFILTLGIDILPYGLDWKYFSEYDTTTDPDPLEQQQAFYQGSFDSFFSSYGCGLHMILQINNAGIGDLKLDIAGLYKRGTSNNAAVYWDEENLELYSEVYDSEEQRISIRSNLFYSLKPLKIRDIIPVIKVGYELEYLIQDDEIDEDSSFYQFDFGLAFKY